MLLPYLAFGIVDLGTISLGAVIGTIIGGLVSFFIRRNFEKKDQAREQARGQKKFAIDLVSRFNSNEVLKARELAENFLLKHTGEKFQDIRSEDPGLSSVWLVTREYEFLSLAIEEELIDRDVAAKYFFEIFMYWNQHFRFGFAGENFEVVRRLRYLEEVFKSHPYTQPLFEQMDEKQQKHINRLRQANRLPTFDFSKKPDYQSL
jgi:hypothetical protein